MVVDLLLFEQVVIGHGDRVQLEGADQAVVVGRGVGHRSETVPQTRTGASIR